jgi:glycosyltransferase involved in cell wall biosynthesis
MNLESVIVDVIIPALDEEESIAKVLEAIPKNHIRQVVVVDNGSKDDTANRAREAGAVVLSEPVKGYGMACLRGIAHVENSKPHPDIVVFMDADFSDYPEQLPLLLAPILHQNMDMVIGSRALGSREKGSMTIPQRFGNWLASRLIKLIYGAKYTDLGPFRAIKYATLKSLNMVDTNYGWTVEMQIKAAKMNIAFTEVAVDYKKRIGTSKVSGTIKGVILAGYKIIWTILKYAR